MKDTEVVDRAIKKAEMAGWDEFKSQYARVFKQSDALMVEFLVGIESAPLVVSYERVIFSSDWAEHFWGMNTMYYVVHIDKGPGTDASVIGWKSEDEMEESAARGVPLEYHDDMPAFEYHLQQLAIQPSQDSRIAYLEKFL